MARRAVGLLLIARSMRLGRRAASRRGGSRLRSVGQVNHTVLVRLAGRRRQVAWRGILGKSRGTGPAGERVDEQMQLVTRPSASIAAMF